ncbi:MAG: hypothetical protein RLZZ292_1527 [Bacteroidota bacterium]|jgi:N-acyl-L-homoserine lactone synthetase
MTTTTLPSCYYEFREPNSIEELEESFKIRYATYKGTDIECVLEQNGTTLDIDSYDKYSIPFLIFKYENQTKRVVGNMRLIHDTPTNYAAQVQQIASNHKIEHSVSNTPQYYFPSMGYNELIKIAISDFKEQLNDKNQTLVEVGRFILDKSERNRRLAFCLWKCCMPIFRKAIIFISIVPRAIHRVIGLQGESFFPTRSLFL